MALTFRQMRYFLVLAEELHFGRAAHRLHISQPPLSASLRQLEESLGAQLLERSSKEVRLTAAGAMFQRQARQLLGQLDDTRELVRRVSTSPAGLLRIGFTPAMIFRGLPALLQEIQRRHPAISVQLLEQNSAAQVETLEQGRIDAGFIHAIPLPDSVDAITIADEAFLCCLPIRHPLAGRSSLTVRDLGEEPLILFDRNLAPQYYDRIIALFQLADVAPGVSHNVAHWLTIVALVAEGMGVALVPQSLARSNFGNVAFIPLVESDLRHESLCIWRNDRSSVENDLLIDCARDMFPRRAGTTDP